MGDGPGPLEQQKVLISPGHFSCQWQFRETHTLTEVLLDIGNTDIVLFILLYMISQTLKKKGLCFVSSEKGEA